MPGCARHVDLPDLEVHRPTLEDVYLQLTRESVYYVPGLIADGLILAAFGNLALSVVRNRESGIYQRRGPPRCPASAIIASRGSLTGAAPLTCPGRR